MQSHEHPTLPRVLSQPLVAVSTSCTLACTSSACVPLLAGDCDPTVSCSYEHPCCRSQSNDVKSRSPNPNTRDKGHTSIIRYERHGRWRRDLDFQKEAPSPASTPMSKEHYGWFAPSPTHSRQQYSENNYNCPTLGAHRPRSQPEAIQKCLVTQ